MKQGQTRWIEADQGVGGSIDGGIRCAFPRFAQACDPSIRVQSDDVFVETRRRDVAIILGLYGLV
jgi:hydrogenase maturation factor